MNSMRRVAVLGLPVLLFNSAIANAATDGDAVEACADAITTFIEQRQGVEPDLQLDQTRIERGQRLNSPAIFELDAIDASTNDIVGKFTCLVNKRAKVRKLVTLPLDAPDAFGRG